MARLTSDLRFFIVVAGVLLAFGCGVYGQVHSAQPVASNADESSPLDPLKYVTDSFRGRALS
jgi:hypothetical protein